MKDQENLFHPVHILDAFNSVTPSAFIPFCSFGGNMSVLGKKIDQFPVPVCNKFVKTTLNGQVCYSIDVNELKQSIRFNRTTHKIGLNLYLDYNQEKQTLEVRNGALQRVDSIFKYKGYGAANNEAIIYFGTLGKSCCPRL